MAQQPHPVAPPPQAPPCPAPSSGGSGLQPNIASLLAYLFGLVGGIIFVLIEKENREVRFHAGIHRLTSRTLRLHRVHRLHDHPGDHSSRVHRVLLDPLGAPAYLIVSIILMVRAYQGQIMKLPVIGDWAAQQAGL